MPKKPFFDWSIYDFDVIVEALTCPINWYATCEEYHCDEKYISDNPWLLMIHFMENGGPKKFAARRIEFDSVRCDHYDLCGTAQKCGISHTKHHWIECMIRRMPCHAQCGIPTEPEAVIPKKLDQYRGQKTVRFDEPRYTIEQVVQALTCATNRHTTRVRHNCDNWGLYHNPFWLMENYTQYGGSVAFESRRPDFEDEECEFVSTCLFGTDCPSKTSRHKWQHCPVRCLSCKGLCQKPTELEILSSVP
jgi:hypothetical protein